MAQITAQLVKELRERTQAGMSDCKAALVEADGDLEKAVEVILKKGIVKAASRAGKVAAEGEVVTLVSPDGKRAAIAEINSQTDFVARGEDFKGFAANVVKVASTLSKGKDLGAEKYPGTDKTIDLVRQELVGKIGENIVVRRWDSLEAKEPGGLVHAYVHMGGKLAVLLHAEAPTAEAAKSDDFKVFVDNAAMQIAAMSPIVIEKSQVAAAEVDKQREIYAAQLQEEVDAADARIAELNAGGHDFSEADLKAEIKAAEKRKGPPKAMWPNVIEGKVTKWYTEVTLLGQDNVWAPGEGTVDKLRQELGKKLGGEVKLHAFVRFGVGDGIEKKVDDLAAEVAKTIGA